MLSVVIGWIIAILGLVVILDLFGVGFGVHGLFGTNIANGLLGVFMIVVGISLASGWAPWRRA